MRDYKITKITAEEILDSRGNPTLRVFAHADEMIGTFDVPSGASTGANEAHELRDGGSRFGGSGVMKAVENINSIIGPGILGMDARAQEEIDQKMLELDGTENKSNLGGNALIGVSIACAKLSAKLEGLEIFRYLQNKYGGKAISKKPRLFLNLINGGQHAESQLAFQEYMIVPKTNTIIDALDIAHSFQKALKAEIKKELMVNAIGIGDEGGYVIDTDDIETPLRLFSKVADNIGVKGEVEFALDVAASSFYKDGKYQVGGKSLESDELGQIYSRLAQKYPIISIEDPFQEEDFDSFAKYRNEKYLTVGDDLTVTNPKRINLAIEGGAINAVIIKPNQIGTLTETINAINLCAENELKTIMSHRSGETVDTFIADLAYAFGCFGIKAGALQRGERIAKYNRLLEIENLIK